MWESLAKIFTSSHSLEVLLFLVIIIFMIMIFSGKGWFRFKGQKLQIGSDERERNIIKQQVETAHIFLMSLEPKIEELGKEDYDSYLTKYCLERAYDEVVNWITFNHISNEEHYISNKQLKLTSLMYSLGIKEQYRTPEFKDRMDRWIKELIQSLVEIRRAYS